MNHIQIIFLLSVFLFPSIQSHRVGYTFFDLSNYYEELVNDFTSKNLTGTQFCESVLLPTKESLKTSLKASFVKSIEIDQVDSCCRSFHKCDAHKSHELNHTNEWNIPHCECIYSFKTCLNNLNNSISVEFEHIHSINTTKCYAKDYPIVKCLKFDTLTEEENANIYTNFTFDNLAESEKYFNRCSKYDLDKSKAQQIQLYDLPLNHNFVKPWTLTLKEPEFITFLREFDEFLGLLFKGNLQ